AQRLVRRLCKKCRVKHNLTPEALVDIGFSPEEAKKVKVYKPYGCTYCNNTGYKGRTALFEAMEVTDDIKDIILSRAQSKEIKKKAVENGMLTLRRSGLIKIKDGITSVEEVLRETIKDMEV
ncbi:MAG: type II secretion system protein GspE, partial [Candidatus Aminicenantes bacterium]|nr:type II secretion system protein GspE [Candidatus Aminicenantes bacterium]